MVKLSDNSRQSLLPSFLYSSASSAKPHIGLDGLSNANYHGDHLLPRSPSNVAGGAIPRRFVIQAPAEEIDIDMSSPMFYAFCAFGGISLGLAHAAVTPLDLVKCNMQIDPVKYRSSPSGFRSLLQEQGARGLFKGWVPTLLGYTVTVACNCGLYVFFKKFYSDIAGSDQYATKFTMLEILCNETIVYSLYKYSIPTRKDQCSRSLQLGVSIAGGYITGVICAAVSLPADNLVSFLNNAKEATVGDAVKKMGLRGLFTRGLPLHIVMTGTKRGLLQALAVLLGMPTTGATPPPPRENRTEGRPYMDLRLNLFFFSMT